MPKTQVVVGRSFGEVHGVTVVNAYLIYKTEFEFEECEGPLDTMDYVGN